MTRDNDTKPDTSTFLQGLHVMGVWAGVAVASLTLLLLLAQWMWPS